MFSFANQNLGNELLYPEGLSCRHEGSGSLSLILASTISFRAKRLGILLSSRGVEYLYVRVSLLHEDLVQQTDASSGDPWFYTLQRTGM